MSQAEETNYGKSRGGKIEGGEVSCGKLVEEQVEKPEKLGGVMNEHNSYKTVPTHCT